MGTIFLDIDGVLNTNSDREISNDKLKLLSELVSKTGADVVLQLWKNVKLRHLVSILHYYISKVCFCFQTDVRLCSFHLLFTSLLLPI